MNFVKVNKVDLLAKLNANLATHKSDYAEAKKIWQEKIVSGLADLLDKAKAGDYTKDGLYLETPKSYEKSYLKAIEMVTMSVDSVLELDQNEFDRYVMDNWQFSDVFKSTVSNYTGKRF